MLGVGCSRVRALFSAMPPSSDSVTAPGAARAYRLAAIDLDGTLLAPDHSISAANFRALARLQEADVEVVLASGRHYDAMHGVARTIPGVRWMISAQGAEVSDVERGQVLRQSFLEPAAVAHTVELGRRLRVPTLCYASDGIFSDDPTGAGAYLELFNHRVPCVPPEVLRAKRIFKVVWADRPERIEQLVAHPEIATLPTATLRSHRSLFEFVQPGVTKATGLAALCGHLGIRADETMAFGDAENDIAMFRWVRTSAAMPHGWPAALEAATFVAPAGSPEEAFARAVDAVLGEASGAS